MRIVDRVCHTVPQSGHRLPRTAAAASEQQRLRRGVVPYRTLSLSLSIDIVAVCVYERSVSVKEAE